MYFKKCIGLIYKFKKLLLGIFDANILALSFYFAGIILLLIFYIPLYKETLKNLKYIIFPLTFLVISGVILLCNTKDKRKVICDFGKTIKSILIIIAVTIVFFISALLAYSYCIVIIKQPSILLKSHVLGLVACFIVVFIILHTLVRISMIFAQRRNNVSCKKAKSQNVTTVVTITTIIASVIGVLTSIITVIPTLVNLIPKS